MTDYEKLLNAMNFCDGSVYKETGFDEECSLYCYRAELPETIDGDSRFCRQWLMRDAKIAIAELLVKNEHLKERIKFLETERNAICPIYSYDLVDDVLCVYEGDELLAKAVCEDETAAEALFYEVIYDIRGFDYEDVVNCGRMGEKS